MELPEIENLNLIDDDEKLYARLMDYHDGCFEYARRRHPQWTANYQLYRDKVITNRLTQRQSVNIPIMKETINTVMSKIDDPPSIVFEDKENDKSRELLANELWKADFEDNQLRMRDLVDKKQNCLYGRSYFKLNIKNGRFVAENIDAYDLLVDRFTDPVDIETANYVCQTGIMKTIDEVLDIGGLTATARYNIERAYSAGSYDAVFYNQGNYSTSANKNERLRSMGDKTIESPQVGQPYLEMHEHIINLYDKTEKEFSKWVCTVDPISKSICKKRSLYDALSIDFYPYNTWATDLEALDFLSDGVADIVRPIQKALNVWFSQLIENRTLRNMGMNFFDSTLKDFDPQTFEPRPFGWYPVPGKPQDVYQRVDIPELSESLDEMQFLIQTIERATATVGALKGQVEATPVTLGQIQIMTQSANERITSMSVFYREAWKKFAEKWWKIITANAANLPSVTLYKKGMSGKIYAKDVDPSKLKTEAGYLVNITSSGEQEQKNFQTLQKMAAIGQMFPGNPVFLKEQQKKSLNVVGFTPEVEKQIMEFEENKATAAMQAQPGAMPGQEQMAGLPTASPDASQLPSPSIGQQSNPAFPAGAKNMTGMAPQMPQPLTA